MPGSDVSILPIIAAEVLNRDRPPGKHQPAIGEIQSAMLQGRGPLGRVESDVHAFNVSHKIMESMSLTLYGSESSRGPAVDLVAAPHLFRVDAFTSVIRSQIAAVLG